MKDKIEKWLQQIVVSECVPTDIVAFNFGIFEVDDGYCIYLIGSKYYDESDDDWVCSVDYEPKEKYLEITNTEMDWEEFQKNVEKIVSNYILEKGISETSFFSGKIVTVGFDDGALERIK